MAVKIISNNTLTKEDGTPFSSVEEAEELIPTYRRNLGALVLVQDPVTGVQQRYSFNQSNILSTSVSGNPIIDIPEITISHTQGGGAKNYVGVGITPNYYGVHGTGNSGTMLVLTPNTGGSSIFWNTERGIVKATKMTVISNIKAGDLSSTPLDVGMIQAGYLPNGSTSDFTALEVDFRSYAPVPIPSSNIDGGVVSAYGLQNPGGIVEPGDANTFWMSKENVAGIDIGYNSYQDTSWYYTFGINVPSNAATKDYRFKIFLEII